MYSRSGRLFPCFSSLRPPRFATIRGPINWFTAYTAKRFSPDDLVLIILKCPQWRYPYRSQQELLSLAKDELIARGVDDWESISLQTSTGPGGAASFRIDRSNGGQSSKAFSLKLDGGDESVMEWGTFADNSPGRSARNNIREYKLNKHTFASRPPPLAVSLVRPRNPRPPDVGMNGWLCLS